MSRKTSEAAFFFSFKSKFQGFTKEHGNINQVLKIRFIEAKKCSKIEAH